MVLGLWDGRLRRAAALVSVEQTFDNLPSNETIICVGRCRVDFLASVWTKRVHQCGGYVDENGWNGGTRAATRATLIFVHMLRTYPSLMMHAAAQRRRDKSVVKEWA